MVICAAACGKPVTATGVAKCGCGLVYKVCVNMGQNARVAPSWICPTCKAMTPRRDNTDTPVKASDSGEDDTTAVTQQLDVAEQLRLLRVEFGFVRDEVVGLRHEVTEMRTLFGSFSGRLEAVEEKVRRLEERPVACADSELAATVAKLKLEISDREQDLLLNDLEITGVPEQPNESSTHLVCLVAKKLGIGLDDRDIVFAERVGARRQASATAGAQSTSGEAKDAAHLASVRPRPLVVRLARRGPRAELLQAARVRRGSDTADFGLQGSPGRFYVNERLTRQNRSLFYLARQECKRLGWRYHWTKDGRVYVRRNKDSPAHRIRLESDIAQVFPSTAGC